MKSLLDHRLQDTHLKPAEGVKLSKIVALQNDLALALAAHPLRIEAPIPWQISCWDRNSKYQEDFGWPGVSYLETTNSKIPEKPLLVCLGKGVTGQSHFSDVGKMPHILIAGATGSGKSVTIHALIGFSFVQKLA
jgi:DNA segregation ATPase FtsK/SpoIIIE, S-DNA-T family